MVINNFQIEWWVVLGGFIATALVIDWILFLKKEKYPTHDLRIAVINTFLCVLLGSIFTVLLYFFKDPGYAADFVTGYLIELSLSTDNLFVFIIIFRYLEIPQEYQSFILLRGILGAIIFRLCFITMGIYAISKFTWIFYIFAFILFHAAYKVVQDYGHPPKYFERGIVKFITKIFPYTPKIEGLRFFVRRDGRITMTPLAIALILIENADIVFAMDSIPAILAVTRELFVVFSSNIFAILGLRSLYSILKHLLDNLKCLKYGLSIILTFIGIKMILGVHNIHVPNWASLSVIGISLLGSVVISREMSPRD